MGAVHPEAHWARNDPQMIRKEGVIRVGHGVLDVPDGTALVAARPRMWPWA